ncbi:hypothetical protein L345_07552, partial [Ophiophagus hannah]
MSTRTPLPTVNERDTENVSAAGVQFAAGASFARPVEGLRGRRGGFAFVRNRGRTEVFFWVTPGASFVSGEGLPPPGRPSLDPPSAPDLVLQPRLGGMLPSPPFATPGAGFFSSGDFLSFLSAARLRPLGNISGVSSSAVGLPQEVGKERVIWAEGNLAVLITHWNGHPFFFPWDPLGILLCLPARIF